MLDDDFLGIDNRREIDLFIPLSQMSEIAHELLGLAIHDSQPKFPYGASREFEYSGSCSTWNNYANHQMRSRHSGMDR